MSCRKELNRYAWHDLDCTVIPDRLKLRERRECVALCVERKRGLMLRVPMPVCLSRILFLNPSRVRQHQPAQIFRPRSAEDPSLVAVSAQPWQISDVVEVRVRQDDRIDFSRCDWELRPIA